MSLDTAQQNTLEDLYAEWDSEKNVGLSPKTIPAFSNKRAFWKCSRIPRHKWDSKISNRTV